MRAVAPRWRRSIARAAALLFLILAPAAGALDRLPALGVDLPQTSVSGISSGGYMAVQFHLAHSSIVRGAGVLAGGPWYCAQGSVDQALGACMQGAPDLAPLFKAAAEAAGKGRLDPLDNLKRQRVWLFSGYNDGVVKQPVMNRLEAFYGKWMPPEAIFYRNNLRAGHSQVTARYGAGCDFTGGEFIALCEGYDAAGAILQFIYGRLVPPVPAAGGRIVEFDQSPFIEGHPWLASMSTSGFLYVPKACEAGQRCPVHVAFHGCRQYAGSIGRAFVERAGYNEWADSNAMIVLYPQTVATYYPFNPKGCWDWWGYTDKAAYAGKGGAQVKAVRAMLDQLAKPKSGASVQPPAPPAGVVVADASAAEVALAWSPVPGAIRYEVERGAAQAGPFAAVGTADAPSFADGGLAAGTQYWYRVRPATPGSAPAAPVAAITGKPAPPCDPFHADNVRHVSEGRATVGWDMQTYARGSGDPMGWWNVMVETTLRREQGRYRVGTCP